MKKLWLFLIVGYSFSAIHPDSVAYELDGKAILVLDIGLFTKADNIYIFGYKGKEQVKIEQFFSLPANFGIHSAFFSQKLKINSIADFKKTVQTDEKMAKAITLGSKMEPKILEVFKNRLEFPAGFTEFALVKRDGDKGALLEKVKVDKVDQKKIVDNFQAVIKQGKTEVLLEWLPPFEHPLYLGVNLYRAANAKAPQQKLNRNVIYYLKPDEEQVKKNPRLKIATYSDKNVVKGQEYYYTISLVLAGLGEINLKSDKVEFRGEERNLLPPSLTHIGQDKTFIEISWEQPNPWMIKDYQVMMAGEDGQFKAVSTKISASLRNFKFTIPSYGQRFQVRVDAYSKESEQIISSSMANIVPLPPEFTAKPKLDPPLLQNNAVSLKWQNPEIPRYIRLKYVVVFKGESPQKLFYFKNLPPGSDSFLDKELIFGKTVYYSIKLEKFDGGIANESNLQKIEIPDTRQVKAVASLKVGLAESSTADKPQVEVKWTHFTIENVKAFKIFRKGPDAAEQLLAEVDVGQSSYTDKEAQVNVNYTYTVIPVGINKIDGPRTSQNYTILPTRPLRLQSLSLYNTQKGILISWSSSKELLKYKVVIWKSEDGKNYKKLNEEALAVDLAKFTDERVKKNSKYYYYITLIDQNKLEGLPSPVRFLQFL